MVVLLLSAAGVGVAIQLLMLVSGRRQLTAPQPRSAARPEVTILKPLKGVDADLAENLRSFFLLDYPRYRIVFGVAEADDPALEVARRVASEHPEVPVRFVCDACRVGLNPKVDNLANMLGSTEGLILISDSNVRVDPGSLGELVARWSPADVGLVSSPIRAADGRGLGAALEALQLHGFVLGGVAAAHRIARRVCVVGKSMLLSREDLDRLGGFEHLGGFLAEDQVCGEEIAAAGLRTELASIPVVNVQGAVTVAAFVRRHLRWTRIRRRIDPLAYAAEVFAHPLPFAVAAVAWSPGTTTAASALATFGCSCAVARAADRAAGGRRRVWTYLLLEPLRQFVVTALWPVAWFSTTVGWRGHRLRVSDRTRLVPIGPDGARDSSSEPVASGWAAGRQAETRLR